MKLWVLGPLRNTLISQVVLRCISELAGNLWNIYYGNVIYLLTFSFFFLQEAGLETKVTDASLNCSVWCVSGLWTASDFMILRLKQLLSRIKCRAVKLLNHQQILDHTHADITHRSRTKHTRFRRHWSGSSLCTTLKKSPFESSPTRVILCLTFLNDKSNIFTNKTGQNQSSIDILLLICVRKL